MSGWIQREAEQAEEAAEFADADLRAAEEWRARALAAEDRAAGLAAEYADLRDIANGLSVTGDAMRVRMTAAEAERDEANAARDTLRERVAEEIGLRLDGHGDDDLAAETGEVRRERDEARRLLAAAARGEMRVCEGCGKRLATMETVDSAVPTCDPCLADDVAECGADRTQWRDLPHAAALRAAIGASPAATSCPECDGRRVVTYPLEGDDNCPACGPDATLTVRPAATQAERDRDLIAALAGALLVERAVAAEYAASEGRPWAERIAVKARLDAAREAVQARITATEGGR